MYPKVLVIANNCFSQTNSNGRTLGNFFEGWPKDSLAQFSLTLVDPDFNICNNYFSITDREALKSVFCGGKGLGTRLTEPERNDDTESRSTDKRVYKTAYKMLLRHFVWTCRRWRNREFNKWVDDFDPEMVMIQSGDSAFMLQLAADIAESRNIPLVFFNTEGYYFFRENYMGRHWSDIIAFPLYQSLYRRIFRKIIRQAAYSIYGNQLLKDDYDAEFGMPSMVLYTSSDLEYKPRAVAGNVPTFSYLGNFGYNRAKPLLEIADVLHGLDPNFRLDIYGGARPDVIKRLKDNRNVVFHGFVSYDEVISIMRRSDILFHAECQDEQWQEMLKYGFSTKVADSISSGSNFILYASENLACSRYIRDNEAAWFVSDLAGLEDAIRQILAWSPEHQRILQNAKNLAVKNHDIQTNRQLFLDCLRNVIQGIK